MAKGKKRRKCDRNRRTEQHEPKKSSPEQLPSAESTDVGARTNDKGGTTTGQASNQQDDRQHKWQPGAQLGLIFAGVVALAAIVQATITSCQLSAVRDQINQMRTGNRAWLSVTAEIGQPILWHYTSSFRIRNFGQLPATVDRVRSTFHVRPVPTDDWDAVLKESDSVVEEHERVGTWDNYVRLIPPGMEIHTDRGPMYVGPENANLDAGQASYFAVITVQYSDASGQQRETQQCWGYDPKSNEWGDIPKHNYMK